MQKLLAILAAALIPFISSSAVLTAEQHGEFKANYRMTLDGTKATVQRLPVEAGYPAKPVPDMPAVGLKGVKLVPSGDQHLAVLDAAGKPLCYYHVVTESWSDAAQMKPPRTFGWLAWGMVGLYFAVVCGMAVYFIRKEKNTESYFHGGGKIPWYVAGMSIFATMLSSISFLAAPAQYYHSNLGYLALAIGFPLAVPLVTKYYVPIFRRLHMTSAYEYLERRFNLAVRLLASLVYVVFMVARVAVVTLLPALALHSMTGISIDLCIVLCGVVTIVYCALGGLEAVVWSDFVQGCVLVFGALAIAVSVWAGTSEGVVAAASHVWEHGKFQVVDLRFLYTEPVFWVILVIGFFENFATMTSDQCVIQRYGTVQSNKSANRSMWLSCSLSVGTTLTFAMIGLGLWAFYHSHPTFLTPELPKPDSILPYYIVNEMHPALAGVVVASIFAATISTLSANLSGASSALTSDFVLRFRPGLAPARQIRWSQVFTAATGVVGTGAALALAHVDTRSLFDTFKEVVTVLSSGLAALFFVGVFLKRVRGKAAFAGLLANYVACFMLRYGALPFPRPHFFLIGAAGMVVGVAVAWLASFVLPDRERDLEGLTR